MLRDLHGYGIVQFIQQSSDNELLVEEGSLYPALQRLELNAWIDGVWGVTSKKSAGEDLQDHGGWPQTAERLKPEIRETHAGDCPCDGSRVTDMLIRRLKYWIESARRSETLREEMELHLAEKAAELQADGMTAEGARAEARRRFGNVGLKHEESREIWMTRFLPELGQDIRYGVRTMTANKAFTALAVLSLGLGIGANTAIYSFMESILLRSLPVADPESLVVLNWRSRPPQNANKEWVHVMHGVQGLAWPGDKAHHGQRDVPVTAGSGDASQGESQSFPRFSDTLTD